MKPDPAYAEKVAGYFERVYRDVFAGDVASNPNLEVEVVDASMALDTPTVILIAPWTLCGLASPPDGELPNRLKIGHQHYPTLQNEVEEIGRYWSTILIPDVTGYLDQSSAREDALAFAEKYRTAVEKVRMESTEVADESRRALLRNASVEPDPSAPRRTAFGRPEVAAPADPRSN